MTKIVISGYYGFGNAGDEAMLSALLDSLRSIIADVEVTVITGNCKATAGHHRVHTVSRMDILGIIKAISRCHILISGGGSLLQDVTSSRSLYYYLAVIRIAQWLHKPVMLYAQGIGPLIRTRARKAVRSVLQHVDLITVRDEASRAELAAIGVTKPPIEVTADAVLSINPVSLDRGQTILAAAGVDMHRRCIGICVRDWKGMTHHQVEIAAAADALQKKWDAQIVFIPMQFPDDIKAGTAIQQRMTGKATVLQEHYSMVELMSLIGSMDVLLGIRLHALVFAALMMVPETAISYDPKIDRFIDMIGEHLCGDLNSVTAAQLIADMDRKLEARQPAADVLEHVERLRELSLRNAHLALNIIEKQRM